MVEAPGAIVSYTTWRVLGVYAALPHVNTPKLLKMSGKRAKDPTADHLFTIEKSSNDFVCDSCVVAWAAPHVRHRTVAPPHGNGNASTLPKALPIVAP